MQPCTLTDLSRWLDSEIGALPNEALSRVVLDVARNIDAFVSWPQRAELLWDGCDRKRESSQRQRYHAYPKDLKAALPKYRFTDRRSNGPAVIAFEVAGGKRPLRTNGRGWSIHHLYDGKFPYPGNLGTPLQAVKDPRHFTQRAGLVAVHPIADALADEFATFAWALRAESFIRFGYDPEGAFTGQVDEYGFATRKCGRIWHSAR